MDKLDYDSNDTFEVDAWDRFKKGQSRTKNYRSDLQWEDDDPPDLLDTDSDDEGNLNQMEIEGLVVTITAIYLKDKLHVIVQTDGVFLLYIRC